MVNHCRLFMGLFRMKNWYGGVLIGVLAVILLASYSLRQTQPPKKQSAYDFFRNQPDRGSHPKNNGSPGIEVKWSSKSVTKPRLVNMEGLDVLYSAMNITEEASKTLLLWPHIRSLLSRSDALPETAQGIKEAAIAWKELKAVIEEEKKASEHSKSESLLKSSNCPFSVGVSTFVESLHDGQKILELPCGLVEDSSITVIGIPNGLHRSFEIELIGQNFSGEVMAPIIFHYHVNLPGENMTEVPFIEQNTWTHELGWGKAERCPAYGYSNNRTVDGLGLCNQIIVRTDMENQNITHTIENSTIAPEGTTHETAAFPFTGGNLFTATLWVGLEGFHMTVNGRHETSFMYREKLEPWSVAGVRVKGGLELLSVLAKGLPVSEDHDLLLDAEQLKAPSIPSRRVKMLVGIFSTGNNFERRMALRRSWMQYQAVRSGDVAVRFFIGLHKNNQVNYELWREAQVYGDIQLMPFVDYYSLISLKTISVCIMGTRILRAKYIMKTDDDAFVRIDEVLTSLKGKASTGLLYGLIAFKSSPHREKDSKWYISDEEWPHSSYPPWAHGPGYIISRDIAKFIVRGHQERNLKLFKLEDVAMGIWIELYKNSGQEVHYESDEKFYNAGCELNYVLAHYQGPRMLLCLWEKLQKEKRAVCCE